LFISAFAGLMLKYELVKGNLKAKSRLFGDAGFPFRLFLLQNPAGVRETRAEPFCEIQSQRQSLGA
jgi:hypothetical protein